MLYNILLNIYKFKLFKKIVIKFLLFKEDGYPYSKGIRYIYKKMYGIEIGYGTYGGCFDSSKIRSGVFFGNYCSIAHNVTILTANHPVNYFTTHPILYESSFDSQESPLFSLKRTPILIGHDVWIGCNVVILPSVKRIGNGAIIGAGSIVTKDVSDYSIVAGNPARVIRMRFNQDLIEKIEKSQWWLLSKEELGNSKRELEYLTNVK